MGRFRMKFACNKKTGITGKKRIPTKEKETEKLFVHVVVNDEEMFHYGKFLTINLKNGDVSESPYALLGDEGSNSMVSIGSVVYIVGGVHPDWLISSTEIPPNSSIHTKTAIYHKGMSFLDLNSNSNSNSNSSGSGSGWGWVEAPYFRDTLADDPSVVAFDGKVYVFFKHATYASIFDPISNTWETLLPPHGHSFDICFPRSVIPDPDSNRILVFVNISAGYFAYYPHDSRWEPVVDFIPFSPKHFFVDGVLYVYNPKMIDIVTAYHVSSKQWLTIDYTSEVHHSVWRSKFSDMLYLGNGLICLVASSLDSINFSPPRTTICTAKIRFRPTVVKPGHLIATPFPPQTFTLDSHYSIPGFLAI